jgi:fatty acid desaturase
MVNKTKKYEEIVAIRSLSVGEPIQMLKGVFNQLQQVISNWSGIPHEGQFIPIQKLMIKPLIEDAGIFLSGLAISFIAISFIQNFVLSAILVVGYLVSTRGICGLVLVCAHHCTHGLCTGNKVADDIIGNLISIITLTSPFPIYKLGHLNHHKEAPLLKDSDAQQVYDWGFSPGKSIEEYWKIFWKLILSPQEHLKTAKERIEAQLKSSDTKIAPSVQYKVAAISYWVSCIGVAYYMGCLSQFLIAIVPPIIIGLQIGVKIEWISRHHWFSNEECQTVNKALFIYPKNNPTILKNLLTDLIVRSLFLPGDLILHAYHHHIITRKWVNTIQEVQKIEVKALASGKAGQFEYALGYENALNILFEHLSKLPVDYLSEIM